MRNRYFLESKFIYAVQGKDNDSSNWGSDISLDNSTREQNFGNELLQGNRTTLFFANLKVGYILNSSTNWRIELGYTYRSLTPEVTTSTLSTNKTHFFQFGMLTAINNHNYDFL